MALVRCILGVAVLLLVSVWSVAEDSGNGLEPKTDLDPDEPPKEDRLSVAERLELVNKNLEGDGDIEFREIDVAIFQSHLRKTNHSRLQKRNADSCVEAYCMWPQSADRKVYVPYVISSNFNSSHVDVIQQAFDSFSEKTCVRFIPRSSECDYLYIFSGTGCWSYVGRIGGLQPLSLRSDGCVYFGIVQHELLHALGFHHEHMRSDRDHYVRVLWENIPFGKVFNFLRYRTLNLGTPYDYGSVMHYSKMAFSINGRPTLEARRCGAVFGRALEMSFTDIERVNILYCS